MWGKRKPIGAFVVVALVCAQAGKAQTLRQNVLAFTDNSPAKMVWVRAVPGASDFQNTTYSYLYNYGVQTSLVCYGTDEISERVLNAGPAQHVNPLITRSGEYVIWNDLVNQRSQVIKWDGTGKAVLASGGNYYVLACSYSDSAKKEFLYMTAPRNRNGNDIEACLYRVVYRVEFVNGTINTAAQELIFDFTHDQEDMRSPFLISGDGRYAGINKWPYIFIWDFSRKQSHGIQLTEFSGCWPNMAPDKSGRFFYFNGAHSSFRMYDHCTTTDTTKIRWIQVASKLPDNSFRDAGSPRYSNHPSFFSISYPLTGSKSAGEFCIGKFNATFSEVSAIRITGTGDHYRDRTGDVWLRSGEGPNKTTSIQSSRQNVRGTSNLRYSVNKNNLIVTLPQAQSVKARLINAAGMTVARFDGTGREWVVPVGAISPGAYMITMTTEFATIEKGVVICK